MPTFLGRIKRIEYEWSGFGISMDFFWQNAESGQICSGVTFCALKFDQKEEIQLWENLRRLFKEAEGNCRPPKLLRWEQAINRPEIKRAQTEIMQTTQWKKMMMNPLPILYSKPIKGRAEEKETRGRVLAGMVWEIEEMFTDGQADLVLLEIMRRERTNATRFTSLAEQIAFAGIAAETRPSIPESVRFEVWRRDQGHCVRCSSQEDLEFDHIIPLALGGSSTARNLQLLCMTCNRSKGATLGWERSRGLA